VKNKFRTINFLICSTPRWKYWSSLIHIGKATFLFFPITNHVGLSANVSNKLIRCQCVWMRSQPLLYTWSLKIIWIRSRCLSLYVKMLGGMAERGLKSKGSTFRGRIFVKYTTNVGWQRKIWNHAFSTFIKFFQLINHMFSTQIEGGFEKKISKGWAA